MMQVEAVIGSLSSTMRKTGLMSPFSSSATGSSSNPSNKKHQRHSAIPLPTNGFSADSDNVDGSGSLLKVIDPARHNNTLPSNISSSSVNGGSTNKNNLLTVNNTSGSSLGRSGLLHATSNGSWASSGNHSHASHGSGKSGRFRAQVVFLDDTYHVFDLDKKAKGSALIEAAFEHLDLQEREYFGLMFNDTGGAMPTGHSPDVMRWLDPQKLVRKQVRRNSSHNSSSSNAKEPSGSTHHQNGHAQKTSTGSGSSTNNVIILYFRVKFYVTDPSRLHEEMTRYHVYLQVKKDLAEGRLAGAPFSTICLLTSYAAQAVLGDYDYDTCKLNYLSPFRDLRTHCVVSTGESTTGTPAATQNGSCGNLTVDDIERRISELHKLHKNQSPAEAEMNFLEHAKRLEMYGISLHQGKDSHGRDIQLGVTCIGLVVFQNQVKINTFSWSKIVKISFKRKQFFIQLRKELTESYDTLLGFNLASYRSCKNLWKSAVEHHSFFRLHSPKVAPRRFLLNLGSKFRYSGRTEFQTHGVQTGGSGPSGKSPQPPPSTGSKFPRSTLSRKTLPLNLESTTTKQATPVAPTVGGGKAPKLASPETSSIGSSVHSTTGGGLKPVKPAPPPQITISNAQHQKQQSIVLRGQEIAGETGTINGSINGINGSSWSQSSSSTMNIQNQQPSTAQPSQPPATTTTSGSSLALRAIESFNNKVQSLSTKLPKKAWQEDITSDDEGGFLDPNRRISSLGRLSKVGTAQVPPSAKVQNTTISPPPCTVTSNSSRSLHVGGGGPNSQSTNTPQSTSVISIKNQAHSSIEATSLSLSKPAVRLAYADDSSLSDRGSAIGTNSEASGFTSESVGSAGNRKHSPPSGVTSSSGVSLPLKAQPSAIQQIQPNPKICAGIGGRSPKPPPLILTTSNIPLTNGNKCNIPQTLNLAQTNAPTFMTAGARTVGSRIQPPQNLSIKADEQVLVNNNLGIMEVDIGTNSPLTVDQSGDGGLVFITIIPDEQGRFGFNVKGGIDQKLPIIVSRVGSNTPADRCYPKLNEGDQVVLINGRDVSTHTHDQVVNFIRASSEPHSGQLTLAVRQNVYLGDEVAEEPDFEYVPESSLVGGLGTSLAAGGASHQNVSMTSTCSSLNIVGQGGQTAALSQSMMLLDESLTSGAIIGQFEQLYRRNLGLSMTICHMQENMAKNRYRDISPYDATRVVLNECPLGHYINANHVIMTIPGSGIVNRYIATQGPLASTCTDFWYMTWESQSSLIIMLTTIVERGRVKCHQYWPNLGETAEFGRLSVTCVKDDSSAGSFAFRDFVVQEMDTNEIRHITQMAYLSWPDHGVPESNDEFVDFVEKVRTCRQGYSLCPTVVHCSAGIGRTGVLILMESALYLIEANQPVYPLELTRIMRDQRASMIQTPAQYRFVCQAILNVFHEGQIKPLPEFASSSSPAQSVKSSDSCSKTNITCKSVISASSSTSNHSDVEKDTNEVISNDASSDNKIVVSDKNSDIGIPTTVVDFEPHHTSLDVLPVVLGQIEDSSPRPESPVSSQESSSAAAPLSTAS